MRAYWQNVCNIILNPFKGSVGVVIILNLLVAVAAFVKDVLFAGYMGTTDYADSLTIAYFIPDTIGYGILATAIGYSCVPVFAKLAALDQEERLYICMRNSFYLFTCLTVMLFMGAFLFRGIIIRSFAGPEHMALTLRLYIIMLPIIILYPWVMIGSSILQAMNRFIAATAAPVIFNIVYLILLLAGIFFSVANETGVYVIAAGILVSVLFMVLLVWHSVGDSFHLAGILRPRGIISSLYKGKSDLREIFFTVSPYLMILVSTQIVFLLERYLASRLETGAVAGLNYAFRLSQAPIWIYVSAVSVVMLPQISKLLALGRTNELQRVLLNAFKQIILISLPTSICLYIWREPILITLFQRGAFDANSLQLTAQILEGYSLMILGQALSAVGLRYFLAEGNLKGPLIVFLITLAINVAADFILAAYLGVKGIGYGAALGASVNALLLMLLLFRKLKIPLASRFPVIAKILLANALLAGAFYLSLYFWNFVERTELFRILYLFASLSVCFIVYGLLLHRMRLIRIWGSVGSL